MEVRDGAELEVWLDTQLEKMSSEAGAALVALVCSEKFPSEEDTPRTGKGQPQTPDHQGCATYVTMNGTAGCHTPALLRSLQRGVAVGDGSGWDCRYTLRMPHTKHRTKGYGSGAGTLTGYGGDTHNRGHPELWAERCAVLGKRLSEYSSEYSER